MSCLGKLIALSEIERGPFDAAAPDENFKGKFRKPTKCASS